MKPEIAWQNRWEKKFAPRLHPPLQSARPIRCSHLTCSILREVALLCILSSTYHEYYIILHKVMHHIVYSSISQCMYVNGRFCSFLTDGQDPMVGHHPSTVASLQSILTTTTHIRLGAPLLSQYQNGRKQYSSLGCRAPKLASYHSEWVLCELWRHGLCHTGGVQPISIRATTVTAGRPALGVKRSQQQYSVYVTTHVST